MLDTVFRQIIKRQRKCSVQGFVKHNLVQLKLYSGFLIGFEDAIEKMNSSEHYGGLHNSLVLMLISSKILHIVRRFTKCSGHWWTNCGEGTSKV